MRSSKILSFSLLFVLFVLTACGGGQDNSSESSYYDNMKKAHAHMKTISNLSQSSKISKQRFDIAIGEHLGPTQAILKQYKDSDFAVRDSYKSMHRGFESYYIANQMWKQDKGMALVNKRLSEGSNWLKKASQAMEQERAGKS